MEHNNGSYARGCRCPICTEAHREYGNQYRATHSEYREGRKVYGRAYYAKNKDGVDGLLAKQNERARATRAGERGTDAKRLNRETGARNAAVHAARRRAEMDELKTAPCMDCGGMFPPECMDWDHRPGEQKTGSLGGLYIASRAKVMAEIAKCDLVCSNCHRIRTKSRGTGWSPREDF